MLFSPEETIVILGTSRANGNTRFTVEWVLGGKTVDTVNLSTLKISAYDYAHGNGTDEFMSLAESLAKKSLFILATPVYWYSMSAQMKTFVDRLSDLITIRKDLGHLLRGKSLTVVASGTDDKLPEGFETPFRLTAEYFAMQCVSGLYLQFDKDDRAPSNGMVEAQAFGKSLLH